MKISVALCTYNGQLFLEQQIESILNQTIQVDEIIVCDDRSTDNTLTILNNFSEKFPQIKVFINDSTLGSVKNFEKALLLCSGEYVFLSDQDDVWADRKVETYLKYFNNHSEVAVLASSGYCIDENSCRIFSHTVWDIPVFLEKLQIDYSYFPLFSQFVNIVTGATICIKKSFLSEVVPFPISKSFHHDEWIAIISSSKQKFAFLREKEVFYRIHRNQQVGGVLINLNDQNYCQYIEMFGTSKRKFNFEVYKKTLSNLANYYNKNTILYSITGNEVFCKNQKEIKLKFQYFKRRMLKHYHLLALLTFISDKINKKRQLVGSRVK